MHIIKQTNKLLGVKIIGYMEFPEILKDLRNEQKLTQKQLAEKIFVSEDCIHFWEKGRSEPSISDLISLAKFFNVTIDYLVGYKDY